MLGHVGDAAAMAHMAATRTSVPDGQADRDALAAFEDENRVLERLEDLLTQFNIFDAFGVTRQELRHSDFLAFLLDPRQPHGLGDAFVTRLLRRVLSTSNLSSPAFGPADLDAWSLDRLLVRREWHYVDLLLVDEEHRLVVIIENKIGSGEIPGQLDWYMNTVRQHYPYPEWELLALYLTPDGSLPSHGDYVPVSYRLVCDVAEDLAERRQSSLDPAVPILLTHYARMLRRHVVADSEIADICSNIYRKHRRALDLIFEHRPDDLNPMREFLVDLVKGTHGLVLIPSTQDQVLFTIPEWEMPQVTGGVWSTPSGRTLLFEFRIHAERLGLALVIGPGPEEIRAALTNTVENAGPPLGVRGRKGRIWTTAFSQHLLQPSEYDILTVEEREARVRERWNRFLENDLPVIRSKLGSHDVAV
jgi:hypothetical protein